MPFDRPARTTGISPSQSVIPSTTRLPEGTPIPVRLQSALTSASSRAGDRFTAVVEAAILVDGQALVARGTRATGSVLEAKSAAGSVDPGYLRLVLVSLQVGGRQVAVETSSIFGKGGSRQRGKKNSRQAKDVFLEADRHLEFRLAQAVDLQ